MGGDGERNREKRERGVGGEKRILVTCCDLSEGYCFSCSASQCHAHPVKQLSIRKKKKKLYSYVYVHCMSNHELLQVAFIMTNLLSCVQFLIRWQILSKSQCSLGARNDAHL